ncbi:MAG: MFS transporter [Candidatus Rokubacteria bacterium]|nr:MFS transporter [Candidatus Rokubacteria bacterium]
MRRSDTTWLAGICAARTGASMMSMAYPAILPIVQREWGLSATAAGSISSGFQFGTAFALVVVSTLADRVGARIVFLWAAFASAVVSLLLPILAQGYLSALFLFSALAVSLAGMYTPGLMLLAERFPVGRRGWAIGWFLASSSIGYTLALGLAGLVVPVGGWRMALIAVALGPVTCAALAIPILRGTPRRPSTGQATWKFGGDLLNNRAAQLMIAGYTFHSWELLGMWAWTPAFLTAVLATQGLEVSRSAGIGANLTALFHVMGIAASSMGGWLSDRWGRTAVILGMMTMSTLCSFTFGWLLTAPLIVVVLVGLVYGFSAIGDSPVYSTGITEVVEPAHLGSVLAVRSLLGFGAGAVAPLVFGTVLDLTDGRAGPAGGVWGWAFAVLGIGGFLGICSMLWLRAVPESRRMASGKR